MTNEDEFPEVGAGETPHLNYTPQPRANPNWIETEHSQSVTQISGNDGPYMVYEIKRKVFAYAWNPDYNQEAVCECGDPYYRHFDTYEEMYPVGCKYCGCNNFVLKV